MLHTQVVTRIARYLPLARRVAAFVLLVLFFHYFTHSGKPYADEVILRFKDSKVVFMERFMQNDINGGSDGSALEALCSSKNWYPERVFSCYVAEGGIASVRQWELQCIRLAIETGGESNRRRDTFTQTIRYLDLRVQHPPSSFQTSSNAKTATTDIRDERMPLPQASPWTTCSTSNISGTHWKPIVPR